MLAFIIVFSGLIAYFTGAALVPKMFKEQIAQKNLQGKTQPDRWDYSEWRECHNPQKCKHIEHRVNEYGFKSDYSFAAGFWPFLFVYYTWLGMSTKAINNIDVTKFESHQTRMARLEAELEQSKRELEAMSDPKVPVKSHGMNTNYLDSLLGERNLSYPKRKRITLNTGLP